MGDLLARTAVALGLAVREEGAAPALLSDSTPGSVMPPARSSLNPGVTPGQALTLEAMFRAFFILQTSVSQLTIDVWRGSTRIDTPSIVARPDVRPGEHAGGFLSDTVHSLAARGNFYWKLSRGSEGSVINLEHLDPLLVMPYRNKRDERMFAYKGKDYTPRDIAHGKLLRVGRDLGLGPIQAAAVGLRGALDVRDYGATWFSDSEIPEGLLTTDQQLSPDQAAQWKAAWKAARANRHDTAVLGAGLAYDTLKLNPAEAQWLESQKFNTTGIARLMGIPPRMMLAAIDGNSLTYANAAYDDVQFVKYTLMAYLREIELVLSDVLPRGQTARFNVDALLRTDTKTRYEAYKLGIDAGWLGKDEVRATEGLTGPAPAAPKETPANA